jgi:hypothetical protein
VASRINPRCLHFLRTIAARCGDHESRHCRRTERFLRNMFEF